MAGIINEKPLLQAEPDEPGGDPPPYVSEMASKIGQEQYANFPPNYSQQNQPQDPHIIMQAPPVHAPGPPTTNSITAVNFAMPSAPVPVGPRSMQMRCHHCQAFIKTKTSSSAKSSAHWACCILFFISVYKVTPSLNTTTLGSDTFTAASL
ncbi:uncharacterized protein [Hetaerina americana]|uniref:uncharacterized protein isoform X2 n=1 Tax=Hetaerina americana TaxID=62018 RepID=UPI003A7F24B4